MAGRRTRHHEDDEASSDGRHDLQELDERADEDLGLEGALLRPVHQAQRDQVVGRAQRAKSHPPDQVHITSITS